MAVADPADQCASHASAVAVGRCDFCGNAFCGECRTEDVATESVFCSTSCRSSARRGQPPGTLTEGDLIRNGEQTFRTGWGVWTRSVPKIILYCAPVCLIATLAVRFINSSADPDAGSTGAIGLLLMPPFFFGMALIQVIISWHYTGRVRGNVFGWTLGRFIPWAITSLIAFLAAFVGAMLFVIPGLYLGLRLFWADEYALIDGMNPIAALKASWKLTEGNVGPVFRFQFLVGLVLYPVLGLVSLYFVVIESAFRRVPAIGNDAMTYFVYAGLALAYGWMHAPEIVRLYAMRAEDSQSLAEAGSMLGIGQI